MWRRFQDGSVSQREGGNELFLVSGFYWNGNPNIVLQQPEDCSWGPGVLGSSKTRIIPKLSECGFLGRLLIVTKQLLSYLSCMNFSKSKCFWKRHLEDVGVPFSWVSGWRQAARFPEEFCAKMVNCPGLPGTVPMFALKIQPHFRACRTLLTCHLLIQAFPDHYLK